MSTHLDHDRVAASTLENDAAAHRTSTRGFDDAYPQLKLRPRWVVILMKHLAPRAHERYLLQGVELSEDTLAAIRAMPRRRPWWLAFLRRHLPLRDR